MPQESPGLHPGDPAPPFRLPAADGQLHDFAAYVGQGRKLALFFFRGTWCHGCQEQLALLRRHAPALTAAGWSLLGIVAQRPSAVLDYILAQNIPFPILIDSDRAVAKRYHVYTVFRFDDVVPTVNNPQNSTFLIDSAGVIRFAYVNPSSNSNLAEADLLAAVAAI